MTEEARLGLPSPRNEGAEIPEEDRRGFGNRKAYDDWIHGLALKIAYGDGPEDLVDRSLTTTYCLDVVTRAEKVLKDLI